VPIFFLQAMNDYNTAPSLLLSAEMARVGKPYQVKIYPPYGTTSTMVMADSAQTHRMSGVQRC
jgi:hypothetical protein